MELDLGIIITDCYSELKREIKFCIHFISDECLSKGLITQETHTEIYDLESKDKQAKVLLDNVSTSIRRNSDSFEQFATILESKGYTNQLGNKIREKRRHLSEDREASEDSSETSGTESGDEKLAEPDYFQEELTNQATLPTSVQETEQYEKSKLRKRKLVSSYPSVKRNSATELLYDSAITDARRAIEALQYAKLDHEEKEAQVRALKKDMRCVTKENIALKKEKKQYSDTLQQLEELWKENDEKLKKRIDELETKLSEAEQQKYNEVRMKEGFESLVEYVLKEKSELSSDIQRIVQEKRDLQRDLDKVHALHSETKQRCSELEDIKTGYEELCGELQIEVQLEHDASKIIHTEAQDRWRSFLKCLCRAACVIVTVVLIMFGVLVSMAYCLEDAENRNIRQCTDFIFSTILHCFMSQFGI